MSDKELRDEMRKEAQRIHESAMHSAQNQFEYSKTWRTVDRWLGGLAALLAATAGTGGLSEALNIKWAGIVALAAAGCAAVSTSLGAPKTKMSAYSSANSYLALQQDCRVFVSIDLQLLSIADARDALGRLATRLQELNAASEIPSRRARNKAKKNIESGHQTYEVDE